MLELLLTFYYIDPTSILHHELLYCINGLTIVGFSENLYHAGYPSTNMKQQRRTLFFSYEPSQYADWFVSLSDEFIEGFTRRQKRLLRRPGHWQQEFKAATKLK